MCENSPPYDPQASGDAEVGVKLWKGAVRQIQVEREAGDRISHPSASPRDDVVGLTGCRRLELDYGGPGWKDAVPPREAEAVPESLFQVRRCMPIQDRARQPLAASGDGRRFHTGISIGIDWVTGQYMACGEIR